MAADARSPLLLLLLVLAAHLSISDGEAEITLDEFLDRRNSVKDPFLIRQITFNQPNALHYEYVARTPADRPIVSAAASAPDRGEALSVAIGGYGERPLCLEPVQKGAIEDAQAQAAQYYSTAADAFASAEYRSEIVSILVGRTLKEVQG
jgi:CO/xanthine dehydrogenase FAD-binding subunit